MEFLLNPPCDCQGHNTVAYEWESQHEDNFKEYRTFFVDAKWNVVDSLQFDTGASQHLQLHGSQGGRFKTFREDNRL